MENEKRANIPEKKEKSILPVLIISMLAVVVAFGGTYIYNQSTKDDNISSETAEAVENEIQGTAESVENEIKAGNDVAVFIGSETCIHCKNFRPTMREYTKNNSKTFYYIDLNEGDNLKFASDSSYLKVEGTPTVKFFRDGKLVSEFSGEKSYEDLDKEYKKAGF